MMMTPLLFALAVQAAPAPAPLEAGWSERDVFHLEGGSGGFGHSDRLEAKFWRRSPYPATDDASKSYWVVQVERRHSGLPWQANQSFDGWLDERSCPGVRQAVERIAAFRPPAPYAADSREQGVVLGHHGTNYTLKAWGGSDELHLALVTTFDPNGALLADLTLAVRNDLQGCL